MITISIPSNWNKKLHWRNGSSRKKSCERFFSRERKKMCWRQCVIADVDGGGYNLLPWRLLHCLFMDAFSLWTIDGKKRELLIFPRQTMKYSNLSVNVEKMWNRWYGWCERCKRMKVRAKSGHQSFTHSLSLALRLTLRRVCTLDQMNACLGCSITFPIFFRLRLLIFFASGVIMRSISVSHSRPCTAITV